MKTAPLIAVIVPLVLGPVASAADLTDAGRAERQELLAWVKTLRYQARTDQALAVCEMIVAEDPDCVDAWLEHGLLMLTDDHLDEAMDDFEEALTRESDHPMALVGRGHVYHAQKAFDGAQRDAMKALKRCNRRLDAGEADAETYYIRGLAKMLLGDESALQDFVTVVSLDSEHLDARTERAQIYRTRGQTEDALEQLTQAVEVRPDYAVGYLARARIHYEAENFAAAVADCDRALEINPRYARAWHNRGLVNINRGDLEAAISDLTEAIVVDPDYASARVYRGQAYLAFGNEAAARADFERAEELAPDEWAGQTAVKVLKQLQAETASGE